MQTSQVSICPTHRLGTSADCCLAIATGDCLTLSLIWNTIGFKPYNPGMRSGGPRGAADPARHRPAAVQDAEHQAVRADTDWRSFTAYHALLCCCQGYVSIARRLLL